MKKTIILLNPSAGHGSAAGKRADLEESLNFFKVEYELMVSESEQNLRELAKDAVQNYKMIVGAGGDGTYDIIINEIIKSERNNVFGMIPIGSSNDITREVGIKNIDLAVTSIRDNIAMRLDVGALRFENCGEPYYFLGTASLGLGATVNRYVENLICRKPFMNRFQRFNGLLGVLNSWHNKEVPVKAKLTYRNFSRDVKDSDVEHGDVTETQEFALMVFNNTSYYASGLRPSPAANAVDGLLNACIITSENFAEFLKTYASASSEKHITRKDVKLLTAKEYRIESDKGLEVQIDGELKGPYNSFTLSIVPSKLNVIVNPYSAYHKRVIQLL